MNCRLLVGLFGGAVLVASLNGGVGQQPVSGSLSDRELGQIWGREDPPYLGCPQYGGNGVMTTRCVTPMPIAMLGVSSECRFKGCGSGENSCGAGKRWTDLLVEEQVLNGLFDLDVAWIANPKRCWSEVPCTNPPQEYFANMNCQPNTYAPQTGMAIYGVGCYVPVAGVVVRGCQKCSDEEVFDSSIHLYDDHTSYRETVCPPLL